MWDKTLAENDNIPKIDPAEVELRISAEIGVHICRNNQRHTFARIAAESSGSIVETQEALGHKNPATTRAYVQRIPVKRDKFDAEVAKRMKL